MIPGHTYDMNPVPFSPILEQSVAWGSSRELGKYQKNGREDRGEVKQLAERYKLLKGAL